MATKKSDARSKWMDKFHPELKEKEDEKKPDKPKKGKGGKCK
jgi:hypothetical protein